MSRACIEAAVISTLVSIQWKYFWSTELAKTCSKLTKKTLEQCAGKLFKDNNEDVLFSWWVTLNKFPFILKTSLSSTLIIILWNKWVYLREIFLRMLLIFREKRHGEVYSWQNWKQRDNNFMKVHSITDI